MLITTTFFAKIRRGAVVVLVKVVFTGFDHTDIEIPTLVFVGVHTHRKWYKLLWAYTDKIKKYIRCHDVKNMYTSLYY